MEKKSTLRKLKEMTRLPTETLQEWAAEWRHLPPADQQELRALAEEESGH